jgi:DNA replication protein DnaC
VNEAGSRSRRKHHSVLLGHYVPLSQTGAEFLFEVFSQRYERASTLVTSNLPFGEWTQVLA